MFNNLGSQYWPASPLATQIEKLKKEKQILDHRSATLHNLPAVQRREVEELKETLAKEQEDHHGKELRLRLTVIVQSLNVCCWN